MRDIETGDGPERTDEPRPETETLPIPPRPDVFPPENPPPAAHRGRWAIAAMLVALILLSGGVGVGIGWNLSNEGTVRDAAAGNDGRHGHRVRPGGNVPGGLDTAAIAAKVDPAIADIVTTITSPFDPTAHAAGTGMVLTSTGEVLTNNHVIQGATDIRVSIAGRSETYTATVVGVDPTADVALIQLQGASGLATVSTASASNLSLGDPVVAIGNALGRGGDPAVSAGTVTALDRSISVSDERGGQEQLSGLIETDAPIISGDSGGALANADGAVVGMLTAAERGRFPGGGSGSGFAIPVDDALAIVGEIRAGHETDAIIIGPAGFMGVSVRDLDPATASQLGLSADGGALVVAVQPGSPADGAGIAAGAAITAVDGTAIGSAKDLGPAIHAHDPGQTIRVTWVDAQGTHTASVRLIAGPAV